MRFGMYFEIILNKKWLFSCRNTANYSCTHMLGSSVAYASYPENILKMWCSLVRFEVYFDQIGGSNYDSLFVRTVAFPVQVAYWTKEVIAPCGYSVPCQI